jgi:hypothetical protein
MASSAITADTYEKVRKLIRTANQAARAVQEENRKLAIPNVYSINDILYYKLPNGELSRDDPYHPRAAT